MKHYLMGEIDTIATFDTPDREKQREQQRKRLDSLFTKKIN